MKVEREKIDFFNNITIKDDIVNCRNLISTYLTFSHYLKNRTCISLINNFISNTNHNLYNENFLTTEEVLNAVNSGKYLNNHAFIYHDISNQNKCMGELEELNIIYSWKVFKNKRKFYMFFIEPRMFYWKIFNKYSFVPPETILLIIKHQENILKCAYDSCQKRKEELRVKDDLITKSEIKRSFYFFFLKKMLEKMNPKHILKLKSLRMMCEYEDYISYLKDYMEKLIKEETVLDVEDKFFKYVPVHLVEQEKQKKEGVMDYAEIELELMPKEEDLIVLKNRVDRKEIKKKLKMKRQEKAKKEELEAKRSVFESIDPFKNCNEFIKFYREVIKYYNKNVLFYPYDTERNVTTQVMDMLIIDKNNNKEFLKSWIKYYFAKQELSLAKNSKDREKTSIYELKKTYIDFINK